MHRICAAARENNIVVVLAYSERADDSLYMSQSIIDATGDVLLSRRKIKPTHMERTIFGDAAGGDDTLFNVAETAVGRVSTLLCWVCQPFTEERAFTTVGDGCTAYIPLD